MNRTSPHPTSAEALATAVHAQPGSGARFDWGLTGAAELGRVCAALVVVDVLSFTTAVEVAVSRGSRLEQVLPHVPVAGLVHGGGARRRQLVKPVLTSEDLRPDAAPSKDLGHEG